MKNKVCTSCEQVFLTKHSHTKTCSPECKDVSLIINNIKWYDSKRRIKPIGPNQTEQEKAQKKKDYYLKFNNTPKRKKYMKNYRKLPGVKQKEIESGKRYYRRNPEVEHNGHLKRNFGITREDFNNMMESQKGVCDICKKPESRKNQVTGKIKHLCVDHCHTTGKIRGLLCFKCNSAIGKLKDSIPILENAITYLKKHGK
jgi:hypothetical protein